MDSLVFKGGITRYLDFIKSKPKELGKYIDERILDKVTVTIFGDYKWLNKVSNEDSSITRFVNSVIQQSDDFEEAMKQASSNEDFRTAEYFKRQIDTLKKGNVIKNLSNYSVIPKYGFPVDVVDLVIYDESGKNTQYDLSRDLSIAISEYAPDSEIIVDDKKYTSRYISQPKSGELTKNYFYKCAKCERININVYPNKMDCCEYCSEPHLIRVADYFVIPIYGFVTDMKNKESKSKKPKKTYSGDIEYIGKGESNNDLVTLNDYVHIASTINDELLVMNTNPFYRCLKCGYTVINKKAGDMSQISEKHNNHRGFSCECNLLNKVSSGIDLKLTSSNYQLIGG